MGNTFTTTNVTTTDGHQPHQPQKCTVLKKEISITLLAKSISQRYLENYGVNVLSKQVEEEPVSHVTLANNSVDAFFLHPPVATWENLRKRTKTNYVKPLYYSFTTRQDFLLHIFFASYLPLIRKLKMRHQYIHIRFLVFMGKCEFKGPRYTRRKLYN